MDKSTLLPWLLNVKTRLNDLTFFFSLITEVCRHTCPPGSPSCTGSLPILPGGPSPKAPGLVLGLQPQPLPLPALSKTPISSLQQICLLLCTWPRSRAVSLGSDESPCCGRPSFSLHSTFASFSVTSCCLYDAAQTPPEDLTPQPHPPTPLLLPPELRSSLPGHALSLLRSPSGLLLSPASASANSTHWFRVQLFSSPASGEGTSLSSAPLKHLALTRMEHLPHSVKVAHVSFLPTRLWAPLGQESGLKSLSIEST